MNKQRYLFIEQQIITITLHQQHNHQEGQCIIMKECKWKFISLNTILIKSNGRINVTVNTE